LRLLLDANLSGRRIARPLREDGHDVVALSERPELERLADPEVLALAAAEDRAVQNYQANMKKAGKPAAKPIPVAAPAKPAPAKKS